MAEQIPTDAHDILDDPNVGVVVTLMADGMPQATPVWFERDGNDVVFNTSKGRVKHENLLRDPRAAITVMDADNPYRYVQVRGTVTMADDANNDHINKMSQQYMGADYPFLQPGEERVIVRIAPDAVQYTPPR